MKQEETYYRTDADINLKLTELATENLCEDCAEKRIKKLKQIGNKRIFEAVMGNFIDACNELNMKLDAAGLELSLITDIAVMDEDECIEGTRLVRGFKDILQIQLEETVKDINKETEEYILW